MDIFNQELEKLVNSDYLPMHMPGAKRQAAFAGNFFSHDITEVHGMDNLQNPEGIIKDIENKAASLYGASDAFISVNGSTGLIMSALHIANHINPGKVLVALNCHISVWRAIELIGCEISTIVPSDSNMPFMGPIAPLDVERKLSLDPSIKTFVMTSPTYEGFISDTKAVHEICKRHNVTFIVDEAHGAHLGLDDYFGAGASADLVIKSLHKTLHAPTQTGVLLSNGKISGKIIKKYINIFQSTSPSYVLMSGISRCINDLYDSKSILKNWEDGLDSLEKKLLNLEQIRVFKSDMKDKSKIVLLTNGDRLSDILREEYHILCEASSPTHLIAMTGIGDNIQTLNRFADALIDIDSKYDLSVKYQEVTSRKVEPKFKMTIKEAGFYNGSFIPLAGAIGKISSDYLYAYPPGIPVLIPGEEITSERIGALSSCSGLLKNQDGEEFKGQIRCFSCKI